MQLLWAGIFLGWGVAIPLGPINIEMIRRNLTFGTSHGIAIALGATLADITYMLLILTGILLFLQQPLVLAGVGIAGAIVLSWFAYQSLTRRPQDFTQQLIRRNFWQTWIAGYLLTLLSPFTILFWSSISAQIATYAVGKPHAIWYAIGGVIIGTLSWSLSLNTVLHFTRHKISLRLLRVFNIIGGLILLGFAVAGIVHSVKIIF